MACLPSEYGIWSKVSEFPVRHPIHGAIGPLCVPVGFSSNVIPEQWRPVYSVNPLVDVIDGFRWSLLGGETQLYLPGIELSICVTVFFTWFGIRQFRKMEKSVVDLL